MEPVEDTSWFSGMWTRAKDRVSSVFSPKQSSEDYTEFSLDKQSNWSFMSFNDTKPKNQARVATAASLDGECSWWNVGCKLSSAAKSTGDFVQSTMLKAIVLVAIVAFVGIFIMSYASAKAGKIA